MKIKEDQLKNGPRYNIASIAIQIDSEGKFSYWVTRVGNHPDQGGSYFGNGECGYTSYEQAVKGLLFHFNEDKEKILELIKEKTAYKHKSDGLDKLAKIAEEASEWG